MKLTAGNIIMSTPLLNDSVFEQSIILIAEINEQGATGFIINKPFPKKFNDLVEFRNSPAFPLVNGGPVAEEELFFIHRKPALIEGGKCISNDIYLGGNFKQAVHLINQNSVQQSDIKLFIGYCGWDNGELQAEIAEGSWKIINKETLDIFAAASQLSWNTLHNGHQAK